MKTPLVCFEDLCKENLGRGKWRRVWEGGTRMKSHINKIWL